MARSVGSTNRTAREVIAAGEALIKQGKLMLKNEQLKEQLKEATKKAAAAQKGR